MEVDDDSNVDSGKVLTALAIALFGVLKQEKTMNVEYYKDAQNVAEAIHSLKWNCKFRNEEEEREERKRVQKKMLDFIVKWFDAVCEEQETLSNVLLALDLDISERARELFNEMIYQRRRERKRRRATELLVE